MIEKVKLEIPVVLPESNGCELCIARLQEALLTYKGVEEAHIVHDPARLCLHYDPNLISLAQVEEAVIEEGINIGQQFGHELLEIEGLDCADCAQTLEKGVAQLDGVLWVAVNFAAAKMQVEYEANRVTRADIVSRIRQLGYEVGEEEAAQPLIFREEASGFWAFWRERRRDLLTAVSGLIILVAFLLEIAGLSTLITRTLYGVAIVIGGYYVAKSGLAAVRVTRSLDMNFLMTIATIGAMAIGEWEEGALLIFLFSLGNALESYTMDRARNAIRSLMDLSPPEATLIHGDHEERVPVEKLKVGDRILVRPGERIPMDGVVLEGLSAVNQAPITGESVPMEKREGDEVYAGTINGQGALTIQVTRLAEDNTLSRIIQMVEEAQAQKAPSQRFVDVFARYYTPAVIILAVGITVLPPLLTGADFAAWFYRALVLLVISCPCALVISTPVSIVSAIASAARQGVLIKGGAYLEQAGALKVIAFDKTGTLTEGRPAVADVIPLKGRERGEVLSLAAAIESRSEHSLAQAVVRAAEAEGVDFRAAEDLRAMIGRGAQAQVDSRTVCIGSHEWFEPWGTHGTEVCDQLAALESQGKTAMLVGDDQEVVGLIAVADTLRPESRSAIAALKAAGIVHTVMLTGDNVHTAQAIAGEVGVDEVRANLLPEGKVQALDELLNRYGRVAMVGDGVNDAPALAKATVGIAMGAAGTDTALETADIALMADDLTRLPYTIGLSRRTRRIIQQNIAFSLVLKAVFMALAFLGLATLWMAVFADVGASLLVTFNGMRLFLIASNLANQTFYQESPEIEP